MTIRKDVSIIENKWNDAQRVDQTDMNVEQFKNDEANASIVQNHFGSGVLLSAPEQITLFDSDDPDAVQAALIASGDYDGTGLSPAVQPTDINLGNQLEVELTGSEAIGRFSVKVVIIGLGFDDSLQMDRFYFHKDGKQVTSRHYKRILTIFTNDFKGNNNCSRNLGGRITIKEAASFQLSADPLMIAQDVEPDIFWRDFKIANMNWTLDQTIQNGMGAEYDVDGLDINTSGRMNRKLLANDVTTQIGQKFKAKTNNIQKITLLLGVDKDESASVETEFDWAGNLVVSIYPLQTSVISPSDIVPSLAIDFDPSIVPIAQLSYSQTTLKDYGYVLNDVPQPVDFVFSSTAAGSASSNVIESDKYYAVTIKRSGAATSGTIFIAEGNDRLDDSCLTLFNGVWVDVPEEDLWFQIWTDAAKVADGQGYDNGYGLMFEKTTVDSETGATIDLQARHYSLANTGENTLNTAILEASFENTLQTQDERNGNPIWSRKQIKASFSFVTAAGLSQLKNVSEPLIIGCAQDSNPKVNPTLEKTQTYPGLARSDQFCVVNPDADLLSLNLIGSKLVPDTDADDAFRIVRATLCIDGYGDVNGDGSIDALDIARASELIGESYQLTTTQDKIVNGEISMLELLRADVDGDGYITSNDVDLITQYVARFINSFPIGSTFRHMCLEVQQLVGRSDGYYDCDGYVRLDGYTGLDIIAAGDLSSAELVYDGYIVTPSIDQNVIFKTTPFVGVTYRIVPQPYWQPHMLAVSSKTKFVPATFSYSDGVVPKDCSIVTDLGCADRNIVSPTSDPGRNDFYVPDNLIIGAGEILRPDGSNYSVDFEIGTIILQLPATPLSESAINIFEKFIADNGNGLTSAGYPAMRYADCSTVGSADLLAGRIRFSVSLQSFAPNLDGYSESDGYGVIVDDIIGVFMDSNTGILKLTIKDLAEDNVYKTLVSKIQINVFLKKAGWKNSPLVIDSTQITGLIS